MYTGGREGETRIEACERADLREHEPLGWLEQRRADFDALLLAPAA